MAADAGETAVWQEADSRLFVDAGRIYTPDRDAIARTFVDLIPAERDEAFHGVEIGHGQGWLMDAVLREYPRAHDRRGRFGRDARCRDRAARAAR